MRRFLIIALLVISIHAIYSNANACFISGSTLVTYMEAYENVLNNSASDKEQILATYYIGFIQGVGDSLNNVYFNLPSNSDGKQIIAIISNYLRSNPAKWNKCAYVLVKDALKEAFP